MRRIRLSIWMRISSLSPIKPSKGGGGGAGILAREVMLVRYKSWVILVIFVVRKVALIGVSYHCVEKYNPVSCPHEYIFKLIQTGFHILHRIYNSYKIQIPTLSLSCRHYHPCQRTWRRRGGITTILFIMIPTPTRGGRGVE